MSKVILTYGDAGDGDHSETPSNFPTLMERMFTIGAHYRPQLGVPYPVDLVREGEGRLSVGIGDDQWMLFYHPQDLESR